MVVSHGTGGLALPPASTRIACGGRAAFTLIELTICLLLIGLMTGFAMQFFGEDVDLQCQVQTPQDLAAIQNAIDQFVAANGRYPRPAPSTVGINSPLYGREVSASSDTSISRAPSTSPVLIGALPHATLNLPHELGADCWGNKFTYAITDSMTTVSGYSNVANLGAVQLRYGNLSSWQTLDDEAAYAVISHGPDALGASKASYTGTLKNCNTEAGSVAIARIDKENCDTQNAIFYMSEVNSQRGARFFDDVVVVANRMLSPNDCMASTISWGTGCSGSALLTLAGLSINVTNTSPGYTGLAVSTCNAGVRTTVGVCLPLGACIYNSPRNGTAQAVLTLTSMNYGIGICKTYKCCNGNVTISNLIPCLSSLDLPGLALSCP